MAGTHRGSARLLIVLVAALLIVLAAISALERVASTAGDADVVPRVPANEIEDSSWLLTAPRDAPEPESGADESPGTEPDRGERDAVAPVPGEDEQAALGSVVPIPPDFAELFERNGGLAAFHAELESEPEDRAWADLVERTLQAHYDASLDPNAYRVLSVECRSSACEILAMGYGDDALRGWMLSLNELVADEGQFEALIGGHGNASCGASDLAPGVVALSCTLKRIDEAPAASADTASLSLAAPYPEDVYVEPVLVDDSVVQAIESSREIYDLHRRLERESVDYSWANYVEPLIAEYVEGLDPARGLDLLGVACRATLCEVQLSARSEEASMVEMVAAMLDFQRLDWHDLNTAAINNTETPAGEPIGIVWILERRN